MKGYLLASSATAESVFASSTFSLLSESVSSDCSTEVEELSATGAVSVAGSSSTAFSAFSAFLRSSKSISS